MCLHCSAACSSVLPQDVSGDSFAVAMVAVFLQTGGVMGRETAQMIQMKLAAVSETNTEQLLCNTRN